MYSTAFVSSRLLHFRFRIPEYSGSISSHWLSVKSVGYGLRPALTSFMLLLYHVSLMKTSSNCLNIPDILVDRLQENTPETLEDLTSLLDDSRAVAELTGFDFRDGKVSMTFPFDETQPERWTTYANLLNRIYDAAMKATRVFPERVEPDDQNEKYLAHVWLQRLGYHGADFKAERKILLGHLKGYCAFGSGDKMQAHKEKYTALRRERRLAEQEAAVLEVMVEEANTNE